MAASAAVGKDPKSAPQGTATGQEGGGGDDEEVDEKLRNLPPLLRQRLLKRMAATGGKGRAADRVRGVEKVTKSVDKGAKDVPTPVADPPKAPSLVESVPARAP